MRSSERRDLRRLSGLAVAPGVGYPMRFAQEALGHNSKAVHFAYAKQGDVQLPSLDSWEREMQAKVVRMPTARPPMLDGETVVELPSLAASGGAERLASPACDVLTHGQPGPLPR